MQIERSKLNITHRQPPACLCPTFYTDVYIYSTLYVYSIFHTIMCRKTCEIFSTWHAAWPKVVCVCAVYTFNFIYF